MYMYRYRGYNIVTESNYIHVHVFSELCFGEAGEGAGGAGDVDSKCDDSKLYNGLNIK